MVRGARHVGAMPSVTVGSVGPDAWVDAVRVVVRRSFGRSACGRTPSVRGVRADAASAGGRPAPQRRRLAGASRQQSDRAAVSGPAWGRLRRVTLDEQFGAIDIYLFDQILRRRIAPGDRIVDAGRGMGRNLVYLLREGYEVHGADADPDAIAEVRALAARLAPSLPPENFRVEPLEALSFPERWASVVISSAVLHFARDDAQFEAMLAGSWRVLASGGMFFCRLASTIGIESQVVPLGGGRRYPLPRRA